MDLAQQELEAMAKVQLALDVIDGAKRDIQESYDKKKRKARKYRILGAVWWLMKLSYKILKYLLKKLYFLTFKRVKLSKYDKSYVFTFDGTLGGLQKISKIIPTRADRSAPNARRKVFRLDGEHFIFDYADDQKAFALYKGDFITIKKNSDTKEVRVDISRLNRHVLGRSLFIR